MVARVIWADMLSIAVTYFITLCLFPGLESEIHHCILGDWLPILIMAVFNLSDFVGKVGAPANPPGPGGGRRGWGQQTPGSLREPRGGSPGRRRPQAEDARGSWWGGREQSHGPDRSWEQLREAALAPHSLVEHRCGHTEEGTQKWLACRWSSVEDRKAQRGKAICLGSHSWEV